MWQTSAVSFVCSYSTSIDIHMFMLSSAAITSVHSARMSCHGCQRWRSTQLQPVDSIAWTTVQSSRPWGLFVDAVLPTKVSLSTCCSVFRMPRSPSFIGLLVLLATVSFAEYAQADVEQVRGRCRLAVCTLRLAVHLHSQTHTSHFIWDAVSIPLGARRI